MPSLEIPVAVMGDGGLEDSLSRRLSELYPGVKFVFRSIRSIDDAKAFLRDFGASPGYMLINTNNEANASQLIVRSGKPVLAIAQTIPASPMYLMVVKAAKADGYPVLSIAAQDILSDAVLGKVKYMVALYRIKSSRVLLVTGRNIRDYMSWAFPNATDVWSIYWAFQQRTGITIELMDAGEFVKKYYEAADPREAEEWADRWIRGAERATEPRGEVVKAARLYLAMLRAARERNANVMAFDCIMNFNAGIIDTWPCLGYMQLWYDGIVPVCEADVFSILPLLIGYYLFNRPGFVNDPGVDEVTGRFVNWHCYAPTNPHGSAKQEVPYIITDAHSHTKRVSIHVKLPINEPVTVMSYNPVKNFLTIHVERAIDNILSPEVCATKLVTEGNPSRVAENWRVDSGYHRVLIYGDFRREVKEFATLMGIRVIEEDA